MGKLAPYDLVIDSTLIMLRCIHMYTYVYICISRSPSPKPDENSEGCNAAVPMHIEMPDRNP